ncbi:hypothetical protein U27_01166 [Candidatus Vecturithrix granuli]|uniref:AAA+ ATPase domain-containing protein n=1 Tax=Vecturithrix granuli TaxID=1499967 RepID=A0A081C9L1_VECG1|nr:hypothetical protein U27_01166 [Candidatus Vecturithrix granuli]
MRKFSSYGQIDTELHYYAPRTALIERACTQLVGEYPEKGGHYITVWAPRQTGKSTMMLEVTKKLRQHDEFDVALISMQSGKSVHSTEGILELFLKELQNQLDVEFPPITAYNALPEIFTSTYLNKPLILILDEFDALDEEFINSFANEFRKIYTVRLNETQKPTHEKQYLLHSLALIGVRSVLGIENVTGSPFNVQRSVHIPNLTFEEVQGMFNWYARESGQPVEAGVVERLYAETSGHPGLVCWFGELLTEGYEEVQVDRTRLLTVQDFERVYAAATHILPNNTLLNILSKAKQAPYKDMVLNIFEASEKLEFRYYDPTINFLYMHGVIAPEKTEENRYYIKFACPYIQKGIFDYFSGELFREMGSLVDPFDPLQDVMSEKELHLPALLVRYQAYLRKNSHWLFKQAPRRVDLRIHEAVYHFNLYMYLHKFLHSKGARVWPEFPTGNGKLDILIRYQQRLYGLEVKSFSDLNEYRKALTQATSYGQDLGITEITLALFIESIDEDNRNKYEQNYVDAAGVTVKPVFIETGV